ncbi:MAG: HYExAFE family protein [Planctomycetota bacterium]
MAQRRHHYERAFEHYLRERRVPYVAVNEARKALLPDSATLRVTRDGEESSLKSFDFVIYGDGGEGENLLVEVKGRRLASRKSTAAPAQVASPDAARSRSKAAPRLENWVGADDVASLAVWERLFGPSFRGTFVFLYWCDDEPHSSLFEDVFEHAGRWYAVRAVFADDYARHMRTRSPRWRTVCLDRPAFESVSRRLCDVVDPDAATTPTGYPPPVAAAG